MNTPDTWPDGYLDWSGGFDELVATANDVLRHIDPQASPLTTRTLRHYQQTNVVGRGEKLGRQALFTYHDLANAVAAKSLVKSGWTLNNAASLFDQSSQLGVSSAAYTTAAQPTGVLPAPASPSSAHAISVVASLMATNSPPLGLAVRSPLPALMGSAASISPPVTQSMEVFQAGCGMSLQYSPQQLQHATPADRAATFQNLIDHLTFLQSIHP